MSKNKERERNKDKNIRHKHLHNIVFERAGVNRILSRRRLYPSRATQLSLSLRLLSPLSNLVPVADLLLFSHHWFRTLQEFPFVLKVFVREVVSRDHSHSVAKRVDDDQMTQTHRPEKVED